MPNIFISYNRKNEAVIKVLSEDMEALSYTVWYDNEISGGQTWWDQIITKVANCDIFVFVLGPESLESTACKREYDYAEALGKPILPILAFDGVALNLLPPALSQIQFVDYREQDRKAAFRLARALALVPPAKPLPNPLPAPPEIPITYLGNVFSKIDTITALSYEEQSALVIDLKKSLLDPAISNDTRALLKKLRKRRDIYATIAEEIDELLGQVRGLENFSFSQLKEPAKENEQRKRTIVVEKQPYSYTENQKQDNSYKPTDAYHTPTKEERIKGALLVGLIGGVLAVAVSILRYEVVSFYLSFPFLLGGLIAGSVSGINKARVIGALIIIAILIYFSGLLGFTIFYMLFSVLLPSVGAFAGMLIENRRKG